MKIIIPGDVMPYSLAEVYVGVKGECDLLQDLSSSFTYVNTLCLVLTAW